MTMTTAKAPKKYAVGEVRPTQLLMNYGVGSIIDLPHVSTLVMGLDDWDTVNTQEISEERLLRAVQAALGSQVKQLLSPPMSETRARTPFDSAARIGVPVATFPRWMVCPRCHLLASVDSGYFELKPNPFQSDRTRYIHHNCPKQPTVLPSRFMIACEAGHLDDFPWHHFVHGDKPCKAALQMLEVGVSGEPSDIFIKCVTCNKTRPMSDAFTSEENLAYHPTCRGRRPHLRDFEKGTCQYTARTMLLSASNGWFPLVFNTLSIPTAVDTLGQLIEAAGHELSDVEGTQDIAFLRRRQTLERLQLSAYSDEELWARIEQQKPGAQDGEDVRPFDLKIPEWEVLSHPENAPRADDFEVTPVSVPDGYPCHPAGCAGRETARGARPHRLYTH